MFILAELRMKKKSTDDDEKPSFVFYRPLIVVLFFTLMKVGKWSTFWVIGHWKCFEKLREISQNFQQWLRVSKLWKNYW